MPDSSPALPLLLTSFIGRARELSEIKRLLAPQDRAPARLLTLTGPGGVGKTSLALHVAHKLREAFADGVHFVSLAPINAPALVTPTIAKSFNLKGASDQTPLE